MTPLLKIGQPRFLSKDEVLTLHRASLDAYGGADGFLNEGALDSALAQARQGFAGEFAHEFPFGMAAAYGFHIAMNHAFRDGNKRTAFAAMVAFLRINGWNFVRPDEIGARLMLELIEQRRDKSWLADQLRVESRGRQSLELRDFFAQFTIKDIGQTVGAWRVGTPSELAATGNEACDAIPTLRVIAKACLQWDQEGTEESRLFAARARGMIELLVATYRLAEDMGYEW